MRPIRWRLGAFSLLGGRKRAAAVLCIVLALVGVGGSGRPAHSQSNETIPDRVTCAVCRITQTSAMPLQDAEQAPFFTVPVVVRADAQSRIWVLLPGKPPSVYSKNGRFLRLVGREGTGPGEYTVPYEAFSVGADSVVVLDAGTLRATVLDSALRPVRYVRLPWGLRPVVVHRWPSQVTAAAVVRTPREIGFPLHSVRFDGAEASFVRSFGPDGEVVTPNEYASTFLPVPSQAANRFWTGERNRFRISEWTSDGRLLRRMTRSPEWFSGEVTLGIGTPRRAPPPSLVALQEDASGLLWVVAHRPKRTWAEGWPSVGDVGHVAARDVRYDAMFETVIEVLDPRSGTVVSRRTLQDYIIALLPGLRAVSFLTGPDGSGRISISSLALEGR